MDFEWDEAKNQTNIAKHGIDFAVAIRIFSGPVVTSIDDRCDYGEVRHVTTGVVEGLLVIAVVHTDRFGRYRIISARPASKRERKLYEAAI
jgi:uncharacterized DUF497 family protein